LPEKRIRKGGEPVADEWEINRISYEVQFNLSVLVENR
jgi:hypothetical protein